MKGVHKMYDEHPDFREYRQLRDKGYYDESRKEMRERMRRHYDG